jgi:hypothetical protein
MRRIGRKGINEGRRTGFTNGEDYFFVVDMVDGPYKRRQIGNKFCCPSPAVAYFLLPMQTKKVLGFKDSMEKWDAGQFMTPNYSLNFSNPYWFAFFKFFFCFGFGLIEW